MQNKNLLNSNKINDVFEKIFSKKYTGASQSIYIKVQFSDDILLPLSLN